jgi:uncharacterized membrane protein HdeD (DUF308 family)
LIVASNNRTAHSGYSLGTLFLLIAACAVAIGMVTPVLRGDVRAGVEDIVGTTIFTGVLTLLIGGLVGLFHHARFRGAGWGVIVGGLIGVLCGPVAYVPAQQSAFLFTTAVGGSMLVIGIAAVIRLTTSARRQENGPTEPVDGVVTAVVVQAKPHPLDPDPEDEV